MILQAAGVHLDPPPRLCPPEWQSGVSFSPSADSSHRPGAIRRLVAMPGILIGYARCSTDKHDLTAQADVARSRRRGRRHEQRYYDRAGDPDGGLVDVARNECLVVRVVDLGLERDRPSSRTLISVWPLAVEVEPVVSFLAVSRACRTRIVPLPLFAVSRRRSRGLAAASSECVAPVFSLAGPRPEGRIRHRTRQISRDIVRAPPKNGPACAGDRPPPTPARLAMSLEPCTSIKAPVAWFVSQPPAAGCRSVLCRYKG